MSILHLTSETRTALADDNLSVNAYPTGCGGFVYVDTPRYRVPAEPDLATIFEAAKRAGVASKKAIAHIRSHIDSPITLGEVVAAAALSPGRFRHLFVAHTGTSFRAYVL